MQLGACDSRSAGRVERFLFHQPRCHRSGVSWVIATRETERVSARASATECAKTRREPRLSHSTICPAHKLAYKADPTEHRNLASEPAVSGVHDSIVPGLGKVDRIYFGKIDAIEQARGVDVASTRLAPSRCARARGLRSLDQHRRTAANLLFALCSSRRHDAGLCYSPLRAPACLPCSFYVGLRLETKV